MELSHLEFSPKIESFNLECLQPDSYGPGLKSPRPQVYYSMKILRNEASLNFLESSSTYKSSFIEIVF
jgi:hypothetical protein